MGFAGSLESAIRVGVLLQELSSNDVVRQTDRVLVNWGRVSDSGEDPDPDAELGSHEFKIGVDELLSNILTFQCVFCFNKFRIPSTAELLRAEEERGRS